MEDAYTHKDLAALCSVSETTIKSYRRKFPGFIPVLTRGKPIRFRKEAGEVCLKIRDCFEKGMSVKETLAELNKQFTPQPGSAPSSPPSSARAQQVVSPAYLDKFFETAGKMMQGMAALATAQAKAGQRLEKVEAVLDKLLEIEARNGERFNELLTKVGTPSPDTPPTTSSSGDGPPSREAVRARKIVNVRDSGGEVRSYALEKEAGKETGQETDKKADNGTAGLEQPPESFLSVPIVIRNEQGEFLGVPGRLDLAGFVEILVREAEEDGAALSRWEREGDHWVFVMDMPGGKSHALHFASTTTPRGNRVILLERLDVDGSETSSRFLQEFFRQIKDKI
jgi:hypothetical protein